MRPIDCPSEKDLRAYPAREPGSDQPPGIETHLVGCRACRLKLLNWQAGSADELEFVPAPQKLKDRVGKLARSRSSFFQNPIRWTSPPFAIAALVLIAITAAGLWRFASPLAKVNTRGDLLRSDSPRVSRVRALFPGENTVVAGPVIEFKWYSETEVSRYTLEVLDDDGDIVYQAVTSTDHLTVDPLDAQLQPQRKYYWHLKAKLPDGTEVETNPIPFSIGSK